MQWLIKPIKWNAVKLEHLRMWNAFYGTGSCLKKHIGGYLLSGTNLCGTPVYVEQGQRHTALAGHLLSGTVDILSVF